MDNFKHFKDFTVAVTRLINNIINGSDDNMEKWHVIRYQPLAREQLETMIDELKSSLQERGINIPPTLNFDAAIDRLINAWMVDSFGKTPSIFMERADARRDLENMFLDLEKRLQKSATNTTMQTPYKETTMITIILKSPRAHFSKDFETWAEVPRWVEDNTFKFIDKADNLLYDNFIIIDWANEKTSFGKIQRGIQVQFNGIQVHFK